MRKTINELQYYHIFNLVHVTNEKKFIRYIFFIYSSLIYKVVAYIKNETAAFVQVGDKSVRFPGYHNLTLNEEASKQICLERTLKKSVFSNKKFVSASLKADKSGYLPDEDVPFVLAVTNPKLMTVSSIVVSLVQKINYSVSSGAGASKSTTNTLDTKEYQVKEPKTEIDWHGKLKVKKRQIPTFSHPMYTVTHMLQVRWNANAIIRCSDF